MSESNDSIENFSIFDVYYGVRIDFIENVAEDDVTKGYSSALTYYLEEDGEKMITIISGFLEPTLKEAVTRATYSASILGFDVEGECTLYDFNGNKINDFDLREYLDSNESTEISAPLEHFQGTLH